MKLPSGLRNRLAEYFSLVVPGGVQLSIPKDTYDSESSPTACFLEASVIIVKIVTPCSTGLALLAGPLVG